MPLLFAFNGPVKRSHLVLLIVWIRTFYPKLKIACQADDLHFRIFLVGPERWVHIRSNVLEVPEREAWWIQSRVASRFKTRLDNHPLGSTTLSVAYLPTLSLPIY
jgi:hypothetical protein